MMTVFTIGQVAKICKVAPRTVSKWFDSGRLRGYRVPGSHDRRIPREYLIRFLKMNGMPLGDLENDELTKVLIIARDEALIDVLRSELSTEKAFMVETAISGFEAGIQAGFSHPECIIVDFSMGNDLTIQICSNLRRKSCLKDAVLIALLPEDGPLSFDRSVVDQTFKKPFDVQLLAARLRTLVDGKKGQTDSAW